jgi:hypothetical protein
MFEEHLNKIYNEALTDEDQKNNSPKKQKNKIKITKNPVRYNYGPKRKTDPWTLTIVTKEAIQRAEKKGGPFSVRNIGYHFSPTKENEAFSKAEEFKKKGTFKSETIAEIILNQSSDWGKG